MSRPWPCTSSVPENRAIVTRWGGLIVNASNGSEVLGDTLAVLHADTMRCGGEQGTRAESPRRCVSGTGDVPAIVFSGPCAPRPWWEPSGCRGDRIARKGVECAEGGSLWHRFTHGCQLCLFEAWLTYIAPIVRPLLSLSGCGVRVRCRAGLRAGVECAGWSRAVVG